MCLVCPQATKIITCSQRSTYNWGGPTTHQHSSFFFYTPPSYPDPVHPTHSFARGEHSATHALTHSAAHLARLRTRPLTRLPPSLPAHPPLPQRRRSIPHDRAGAGARACVCVCVCVCVFCSLLLFTQFLQAFLPIAAEGSPAFRCKFCRAPNPHAIQDHAWI